MNKDNKKIKDDINPSKAKYFVLFIFNKDNKNAIIEIKNFVINSNLIL